MLKTSKRSIVRWLLPGLLLLTSGCFRPAGEAAVPTSGAAVTQFDPSQSTPTTMPPDTTSPTSETSDAGDTLAITLVSPESLATETAIPTEVEAATQIETIVPTEVEPTVESVSGQEIAITPLVPTETTGEQSILEETPISPLPNESGDEPPSETPTPLTTFVIATPTPSAQFITPSGPEGPVVISTLPSETITGDTAPDTADGSGDSSSGGASQSVDAGDRCEYIVRNGDNLYRIALQNDVSLDAMRQANPELTGENPVLLVGQRLFLPECAPQAAATATPAPLGATAAPTAVEGELYTVRPGDTLFAIAQRNGVTVNAIIGANNLTNPDRLTIGQQLIIPSGN